MIKRKIRRIQNKEIIRNKKRKKKKKKKKNRKRRKKKKKMEKKMDRQINHSMITNNKNDKKQ